MTINHNNIHIHKTMNNNDIIMIILITCIIIMMMIIILIIINSSYFYFHYLYYYYVRMVVHPHTMEMPRIKQIVAQFPQYELVEDRRTRLIIYNKHVVM